MFSLLGCARSCLPPAGLVAGPTDLLPVAQELTCSQRVGSRSQAGMGPRPLH